MKSTRLTAILTLALLPSVASANDYQGNLLLSSQADVDAASAYTGVTGNLTISGGDIVDLGPLDGFTQVGGYILMQDNPSLTQAIAVFPSLADVGGGLWLYDNDSLLELSGFDALLQTGDNIDFWYNDVLQSISGFASLQAAGWSLEFGENPDLVEIPEFASLQTISSSLFILDNNSLEAITGFQALEYVDWSFQIMGNSNLNEICGLYNYFVLNNPYTGGGAFDIKDNGPGLPNPMTEQDVVDAGPCSGFVGTNYCGPANLNSSGFSAVISGFGSTVVDQNNLELIAELLPMNKFGYFLVSETQDFVANPGGSQGNLCLGGTIGRYAKQVQNSGSGGEFSMTVDLTALPFSPPQVVLPGETWSFQAWYRDNNPDPTSNFTDGLSITFQ